MTDETGAATGTKESLTLSVPDMDCPSCAGKVDGALASRAGVETGETHPATGRVHVTYDPRTADPDAIVAAVEGAGYEVTAVEGDGRDGDAHGHGRDPASDDGAESRSVWTSGRALKTWASGVLLTLGLLARFGLGDPEIGSLLGYPFTGSDALFVLAVAVAGQAILRNGYHSLRARNLDIDLLMSVAIVAAAIVGLYLEAATLAVLFSVAELLERYSVDRARRSLRELMELAPEEATVRRDGEEVRVPVEAVAVGERVLVRPGEKIPVDGVVREGRSAVDQSPVTGESMPVDKGPDDEVYAGTMNEEGYVEIEATTDAASNTLSRIIDLVEAAGEKQTESEQFVDRFARYYTPVVVAAAVAVAAVPPLALGAPWRVWFLRGIAMLVLACPCAFVISTPVTVVSAITSAARNGVLIKGGSHLEAMGEVDAVALDKTGTLTTGDLAVTDVIPLEGNTEADVLDCARGLERRSEHPVGEAIVAHAAAADVAGGEPESFESLTGRGVRADLHGETHYAGKPGLFRELGFDLDHVHVTGENALAEARSRCHREGCLDLLEDTIPRLQSEGKTVVLVGTDEGLEGVVAVADSIRPEAPAAVAALREAGARVVMLTGDSEGAARTVADRAGVDEYRAGLLPEEKVEAVEELREERGSVAFVGDGVNDAPALATATVGIAMGAAGTDAAIETADIALMGDDLSRLPYLHDLARSANRVIRQNVWASLGAKALLAVGVPLGYVQVWLAVLAGDAGMTTAVTGNAMRLTRLSPTDAESPTPSDDPPGAERPLVPADD